DLSPDAFCTLSPLELDGVQVVFACDVLRGPEPGVFDIHLDKDLPVAFAQFPFRIKFEIRVDTTDILPADDREAGNGGADCEVFPVDLCDLRGPESPGKDREAHLYFSVMAVLGYGIRG